MFGITFARALERARHANPSSAQCIDGWLPVEPSSTQLNNGHEAGKHPPKPNRSHAHLRLVWRTHGTPPEWIDTAA